MADSICGVSSCPDPNGLRVDPHCVRVGGVQGFDVVSPSGKVAGSPALPQSIARLDASVPDHACPYDNPENNSNIEIRGEQMQTIASHLPLASDDDVLRRKESLVAQRCRRQTRKCTG